MIRGKKMHQPILEGLEAYLDAGGENSLPREFKAHMASCMECRREVELMREQSLLLQTLRAPADAEPRAGFYGRVMDRIESQKSTSFWSEFLEPAFGRRLMVSTALLLVLLGGYLLTTGPNEAVFVTEPEAVFAADDRPVVVMAEDQQDQEQNRERVLVRLASYQE
ncbi:MAG: hypothetical protein SFV54_13305 [Bryobacteraceae bacterium]|nr:hypothetical protein [Bryobacteraceae bacterium]